MCLQKDNNIGFLYEEDTYGGNGGYTIVYKNYSVEYLTDSAYVYDADVDKTAIVSAGLDSKLDAFDADAPAYVGSVDKASVDAVSGLIEAYKATPSYEAYEAINAAIANLPQLEVEAGKWYRIRNTERSGATLYLNPETSRVSTAKSVVSNANQLFSFVPTGNDKEYYLYNGNFEYYLGPLGANETQPIVTTDKAAAGTWKVSSTADGKSSIICQNKTGSNTGLHLAGDNVRLVPWTNNAPASLWFIEPVDEFELAIDGFAAVRMPFTMTLPEGVVAYTAGAAQEVEDVTVAPLAEYGKEVVAAGVPVILAAENGTYAIGVGDAAEPFEGNNQLQGVLKSAAVSGSDVYTLSGNAFVKRTSATGTVKANTAYYTAESEAGTIELRTDVNTSIDAVVADGAVEFYDLKGNRVEKPVRGIYVTSQGVKVLVK